jgi:hypothetical protein
MTTCGHHGFELLYRLGLTARGPEVQHFNLASMKTGTAQEHPASKHQAAQEWIQI